MGFQIEESESKRLEQQATEKEVEKASCLLSANVSPTSRYSFSKVKGRLVSSFPNLERHLSFPDVPID